MTKSKQKDYQIWKSQYDNICIFRDDKIWKAQDDKIWKIQYDQIQKFQDDQRAPPGTYRAVDLDVRRSVSAIRSDAP